MPCSACSTLPSVAYTSFSTADSTFSPLYPTSVKAVAFTDAKGTSRIFAAVSASRVLPVPVGLMRRMLLFPIGTPPSFSAFMRFQWLYMATETIFFACSCPIMRLERNSNADSGVQPFPCASAHPSCRPPSGSPAPAASPSPSCARPPTLATSSAISDIADSTICS